MSKFGLLIVTYIQDDTGNKMRTHVKKQFVDALNLQHAQALRDALEYADQAPLLDSKFANQEYHVAFRHQHRHGGTTLFTMQELRELVQTYEEEVTTPPENKDKALMKAV